MALSHSPSIVTSGLQAYFDPANSKCFTNSENLLLQSEDITAAPWGITGVTVRTANQATAPNGTFTADLVTNTSSIFQDITVNGLMPITMSVYVKGATATPVTNLQLAAWRIGAGANSNSNLTMNPSTGAYTASGGGASSTLLGYSITDVGNGWYRISLSSVGTNALDTTIRFEIYNNTGATASYYVWGAQVEYGAEVSDYVATTAAVVNRQRQPTDLSGNGRAINIRPVVATGPCPAFDSFTRSIAFNPAVGAQSADIADFSYPAAWTDPFSASVWMYVPTSATWSNGTNNAGFVMRGTYSGHHGLARSLANNVVLATVRGTTTYNETWTTIGRDAWYNVGMSWSGGNTTSPGVIRLYINGTQANTQTGVAPDGAPEAGAPWIWGGNDATGGTSGAYYTGKSGPVKIYNRLLSDAEFKQNFNALRGRFGV